jgi:beta-phosphoglucomutase-like phosphatase (HAD superfamily)
MRAFIFDLDGTLIDSVYAHVLSWQRSFAAEGMQVPAWSIHTKIGLGGQELALAIGRELGNQISGDQADGLDKRHSIIMKELLPRAERASSRSRRASPPPAGNECSLGHSDLRRSVRNGASASLSRPLR